MDDAVGPRWHQALVYAVTGERRPELGRQDEPDLEAVERAVAGLPHVPSPVPTDLMKGIGAAHFAAVLTQLDLRRRAAVPRGPVLADRAPDRDERRLLAEVPPHH